MVSNTNTSEWLKAMAELETEETVETVAVERARFIRVGDLLLTEETARDLAEVA